MATRAYDRSLEESERQRMEELSRYGGSYEYGEPAWGRQQQQWNQSLAGGYTQPLQQQFTPYNPFAQYGSFALQNPFFGMPPWAVQSGINPYAGIDPITRQSLLYNQLFSGAFGQTNPSLYAGLGSGYGQPFGASSPMFGQQGTGGFIDPLQLRQLQLWNLGLGVNQPWPVAPGFISPFSFFPQGPQQFGLPFGGQQTGLVGGGRQSEPGRSWGIPRLTRRAPKGYKRPDEFIRDDISERLAHYPYLDATNCEVIVKDGEVTVRGTVDDRIAKNILEEIAESVFGVKDVLVEVRVGQPMEREQEMAGATKGREK